MSHARTPSIECVCIDFFNFFFDLFIDLELEKARATIRIIFIKRLFFRHNISIEKLNIAYFPRMIILDMKIIFHRSIISQPSDFMASIRGKSLPAKSAKCPE